MQKPSSSTVYTFLGVEGPLLKRDYHGLSKRLVPRPGEERFAVLFSLIGMLQQDNASAIAWDMNMTTMDYTKGQGLFYSFMNVPYTKIHHTRSNHSRIVLFDTHSDKETRSLAPQTSQAKLLHGALL